MMKTRNSGNKENTDNNEITYCLCQDCHQPKAPFSGCTVSYLIIDGKKYDRIKTGDDLDFDPDMDEDDICHDCFAGFGRYHHYGCDAEQCPSCHNQLIGCGCNIVIETIDQ